MCLFFFFKQKTAYEMRISDWSSDVCSSDLSWAAGTHARLGGPPDARPAEDARALRHRSRSEGRMKGQRNNEPMQRRERHWKPRIVVVLMVAAGVLLFAGANAHLIHVAVTSQPDCVPHPQARSEDRRVGKECVSTFKSRLSP